MSDRIRIDYIKYIIMMIPFFEPLSLSLMENQGIVWKLAGSAFAVARYLVALYFILLFINFKQKRLCSISVMCVVFILIRLIASAMNGSVYFSFALSTMTYIGFLLFLRYLAVRKSPECMLEIIRDVFLLYSMLSVPLIILFPNGFNHAATKAEAIYFLGSKNSGFYYYFGFLAAYCLLEIIRKKRLPRYADFFFFLFMGASYICDSSNSVGSLGVLYLFYLLIRHTEFIYKVAEPRLCIMIIAFIALLLMFGRDNYLFSSVFSMLGRDTSLTGRDYIWEQQLMLVGENPVWGNGIQTETVIMSGAVATHAHNFYLDTIAKFGMFSLIMLLLIIGKAADNLKRMAKSKYGVMVVGILFTILLHNTFDDISLYLFFAVLYLTEMQTEDRIRLHAEKEDSTMPQITLRFLYTGIQMTEYIK